jgi:ParB family chromosome partitioning protein
MASVKDMLAKKLAENTKRHAEAAHPDYFDYGRQHTKIPVDAVDPNPYQPRKSFPQNEIDELAESIREAGKLIQPITVRRRGDRYELVTGERRLRAHKQLSWTTIEALVSEEADADMAVLALTENISREDLSDYEIAVAIRNARAAFPSKARMAEAMGMQRSDLYRYMAFDSLPEPVIAKLEANPRLFSRVTAEELKTVTQNTNQPASAVEAAIIQAIDGLERGEIDAHKLGAHVRELLVGSSPRLPSLKDSMPLLQSGKRVGQIVKDAKSLTVKINARSLSERQESELRAFLQNLLSHSSDG